jgi:hypothetical protein
VPRTPLEFVDFQAGGSTPEASRRVAGVSPEGDHRYRVGCELDAGAI